MHFPQTVRQAESFFKLGNFNAALKLFTDAQRFLLFKQMYQIGDSQVQHLQERRFACFRSRHAEQEA